MGAAGFAPATPGEPYRPDPQSENTKNWWPNQSASRWSTTDAPLGAYPYLWTSALISVTPSTRKSQGGTSRPSASMKGSTNPPMHASTWQPMPRSAASAAMSATGSMTPYG